MNPILLHDLLALPKPDPDRPALIEGSRSWSFRQLSDEVEKLAAVFQAAGVERGDRIAILLPKNLEKCAAIFASSRVDAVFVPINPLLKPQQIRHILVDSGAKALYTDAVLPAQWIEEAFANNRLTTGETVHYGYGWHLKQNQKGEQVVYHTGSTSGFRNVFYRIPSRRFSIILLTNRDQVPEEGMLELAEQIAAAMD